MERQAGAVGIAAVNPAEAYGLPVAGSPHRFASRRHRCQVWRLPRPAGRCSARACPTSATLTSSPRRAPRWSTSAGRTSDGSSSSWSSSWSSSRHLRYGRPFHVVVPCSSGPALVGGLTPLLRTPPPRSDTASQIFLPNSMESLTPSSYRLISRRRPWPCIVGGLRPGMCAPDGIPVAREASRPGLRSSDEARPVAGATGCGMHRQGAPESAAAAGGVSIGSCGRYRSWSRRRVR